MMQLGVNCIAPASLPMMCDLVRAGEADVCELMLDNFIHLPPKAVLSALDGIPTAFHLVGTRFLERSPAELHHLADMLRRWMACFNPLYVSDHLVQFSFQHQRLPVIRELDYAANSEVILERVTYWQSLLKYPLLIENHASLSGAGHCQPDFFANLQMSTGAGLLFDISNAHIAELNGGADFAAWVSQSREADYFHVGGFRMDAETGLALDTHDQMIAEAVLARIANMQLSETSVLIVECDAATTLPVWQAQLHAVRLAASRRDVSAQKHDMAVDAGREKEEGVLHQLDKTALRRQLLGRAPQTRAWLTDECVTAFLAWSEKKAHTQNWAWSIHLLDWLAQQSDVPRIIKTELLQTAAIRWSLNGFDHPGAQGMLIASPHLPGEGVGIWKAAKAGENGRHVQCRLPSSLAQAGHCYALSARQNRWDNLEWVVVPP